MDLRALQLVSRFSLPPNSLGYCGENSAVENFKKCVVDGICDPVKEEIEKFIVLHPYLKTLSEISGKSKFSYEVVEAYWLGNSLLDEVTAAHYDILLRNFEEQGVPSTLIHELRGNPPKKFIPIHLFQVLRPGVGRASGSVPFNIESVDNCMIRWGEVQDRRDGRYLVDLNSLSLKKDKYILTKISSEALEVPGFTPALGLGSVVAVHWGQIVKILTEKEERNIELWTQKVLASVG